MVASTRQISQSSIHPKSVDELKNSLSQMAYDLASMKNVKAPVEEICVLESIWRELLGEYLGLIPVERG